MTKDEEKIAELAVNKAEEICKTIDGFDKLDNDSKSIAIIFGAISILNTSFKLISKMFNK